MFDHDSLSGLYSVDKDGTYGYTRINLRKVIIDLAYLCWAETGEYLPFELLVYETKRIIPVLKPETVRAIVDQLIAKGYLKEPTPGEFQIQGKSWQALDSDLVNEEREWGGR